MNYSHDVSHFQLTKFKVRVVGKKKPVLVEAEYFKVEDNGNLVFRILQPGGYPIMVKTFASGYWQEIERSE